jgi:hypothetical protein
MTTQPPGADWYPDPSGKPGLMYWDGRQWHKDIPETTPADQSPAQEVSTAPHPQRHAALITALCAAVALLVGVVAIAGYLLLKQPHRSQTSPAQPAPASSVPTAQPAPPSASIAQPRPPSSQAAPSAAAPSADLSGLAPFAREWRGMRESVVIESTGHGHYHYMMACASCSMADMPYNTLDFTLTSVSNGTASGTVTASSDPQFPVGEPVAATLGEQDTIQWAVGGKNIGLFCGSNAALCGS